MAQSHSNKKDLGETWLLTNQTVFSNLSVSAKASIVRELELAYPYFSNILNILQIGSESGGMIIENENSTLLMGNFETENGKLTAADGEWIEGVKPSFDYCLARM